MVYRSGGLDVSSLGEGAVSCRGGAGPNPLSLHLTRNFRRWYASGSRRSAR